MLVAEGMCAWCPRPARSLRGSGEQKWVVSDVLEPAYEIYRESHPCLGEAPVNPKSIVRDRSEPAMTFGEYLAHYKLQRVGASCCATGPTPTALRHTAPERYVTDQLDDLTDWLGETIRISDSWLDDEWKALTNPDLSAENAVKVARHPGEKSARPPATCALSASWSATACGAG